MALKGLGDFGNRCRLWRRQHPLDLLLRLVEAMEPYQ
jgi:hypothetical protein